MFQRSSVRFSILLIAAASATCTRTAAQTTDTLSTSAIPSASTGKPEIVVEPGTFKAEVSDACYLRVSGVIKPPNISWKVSLVRNVSGDFNETIYTLALEAKEPKGRQSRTQRDVCVVYPVVNQANPPTTAEICKLKQVVVTGGDQPVKIDVTHPLGRSRACAVSLRG